MEASQASYSHQQNKCVINKICIDGEEISEPMSIANVLNEYFANIGPKLAAEIPSDNNKSNCSTDNGCINEGINESFYLEPICQDFVLKQIQGLATNKATGCDNCPVRLIKLAAPVIVHQLTCLINRSITTGTFPQKWKKAKVTPIHKGGDVSEPSNYRPISVLSIFSKILERAVFDQLYKYMNLNKFLNQYQSGFRPLRSTSTALINITDDWLNSFDNGEITGVVMLDLKKAFDTVDLDILIHKLKLYGIDRKGIKWFTSYLQDRSHFTSIQGNSSTSIPIRCGVPQGSIIGPLLFIIYINDLPNNVSNCKVSMYADDTALYYASKDINELVKVINDDLINVTAWLNKNKLSLNVNKTEVILLGTKSRLRNLPHNDINININGTPLSRVKKCKHLGVIVDENLSWSDHIDQVRKKALSGMHVIRKVKNIIPQSTRNLLYNTIVSSHFDYCDVVWGNCGVTLQEKLQKLQNRSARIIRNVDWSVPSSVNLKELNWISLNAKRRQHDAIMMYKIINNHVPQYLTNKFNIVNSGYALRRSNMSVSIPMPKTKSLKRSFSYRGATTWNSIQANIQNAPSVQCFKKNISICV